ncbi:MAG: mitofilin family membrane protein [Pseudomonadota bacterium]
MSGSVDLRGPALATRQAIPLSDAPITAEEPQEILVEATPDPEPAPAAPPAPKAEPERRRGGFGAFLALLLGGAAAAALGFFAAGNVLETGPDPELTARIGELETNIGDMGGRLEDLAGSLETLRAAIPEPDTATADGLASLSENFAGLTSEFGTLQSDLGALSERVNALPLGVVEGTQMPDFTENFNAQMAQFQEEMARVTGAAEAEFAEMTGAAEEELGRVTGAAEAEVAAAMAEAEATRDAAEKAETQATLRAALAKVSTALDTGEPFDTALTALDGLEIPAALADVAADGVAPLSALQTDFPSAAREALKASARGPEEGSGTMGRVAAFLVARTNARSLEPRDGDDADAVLSRAEAALRSGDLNTALTEVGGLEDASRAALGPWLDAAESRSAAVDAASALSASIDNL